MEGRGLVACPAVAAHDTRGELPDRGGSVALRWHQASNPAVDEERLGQFASPRRARRARN